MSPSPSSPLRVAVLHNLKENAPSLNGERPKDALAELDSVKNVNDYATAIRALGHTVFTFEGNLDLPAKLREHHIDICFNTCEGFRGDSREAQVPAMLEMMGMPYTASKVLALALTLDKAMTKRLLHYYNLPTPVFQEFTMPTQAVDEPLLAKLRAGRSLFIKPNREGTGIGIHNDAVIRDEATLRRKVDELLHLYHESVLVEEYVEGRDVTCGLVGNGNHVHFFPISEIDYSAYPPGTPKYYSYELKVTLADLYRGFCPAPIPEEIAHEVRRLTLETFRACGCYDMARVDFRLDTNNNLQPMIIEINALPGLTSISDLTLCAEAEGISHAEMIQMIFEAALKRHGLQ